LLLIENYNRLLTAKEVAQILGVKISTIKKWVFERRIPFVKFGPGQKSLIKFNPLKLNEWIDQNSHEPGEGLDKVNKYLSKNIK